MRSNLKALGLALFALLALGAVAAQGASAHEFEAGSYPAIVTAEQDPTTGQGTQTFTAAGNTVICHQFHADGTQSEKSATLELLPQYPGKCEVAGFNATVTNKGTTKLSNDEAATEGGCKYVFHGATSANGSTTGVEDGAVDIQCEGEAEIEIEVFADEAHTELLCRIGVGDNHEGSPVNQGLHGVKYNNVQTEGKPEEVTAEAKVHNVKYTSEGLCFLLEIPETGEAIYEGKATVRAFEDRNPGTGNQVNATVSNP